MRNNFPESKIGMITVFPPGTTRSLAQQVLQYRWKIKGISGYTDDTGALFEAYNVTGVPFSVLYDKYGKEVKIFEGMPNKAALEAAFKTVVK